MMVWPSCADSGLLMNVLSVATVSSLWDTSLGPYFQNNALKVVGIELSVYISLSCIQSVLLHRKMLLTMFMFQVQDCMRSAHLWEAFPRHPCRGWIFVGYTTWPLHHIQRQQHTHHSNWNGLWSVLWVILIMGTNNTALSKKDQYLIVWSESVYHLSPSDLVNK